MSSSNGLPDKVVPFTVLIEIAQAAHLTYCVDSPFPQRSGILYVAPQGNLKTTALEAVDETFHNFKLVSDLQGHNLMTMQDDLFSGNYPTLAFKDMIKLYERQKSTAENLEGTLRSMVEEGWTGSAMKDSRIATAPIRLMVMGAMTKHMYEFRLPNWIATGFARRFLWCHYKLEDPTIIGDAIEKQQKISFDLPQWPQAQRRAIPFNLDEKERREIRQWMKEQQGKDGSPYNLLLKIAVVLKWRDEKLKREPQYMKILRLFARTLQNKYVDVGL